MRPSSGTQAAVRSLACVIAVLVAVGFYGHVRAQSATGSIVLPLRPLAPLSSVPVPPVFGMEGIIADKTAAAQLGKALFWDMQSGSDDIQACATCHFNAGADSRTINSVNPGQNGGDTTFQIGVPFSGGFGPNHPYTAGTADSGFGGYHDGDFPFHKLSNPDDRNSSVISDVNDVSGSQGVFATRMGQVVVDTTKGSTSLDPVTDQNSDLQPLFGPIGVRNNPPVRNVVPKNSAKTPGSVTSVETGTATPDPVFSYPDPDNVGQATNTRRVTPRNTPSVVDAVFNFRNFWDGRAQNTCNGASPFGSRDKQSHLLVGDPATRKLGPAFVAMQNSALCSQSLGPILSNVEMSADGRDFRQVGKKLLARAPLAKQMVDPTDSLLGAFSNAPNPGINTTYAALIQKAFQPDWWRFTQHVCVAADGSTAAMIDPAKRQSCPANTQEYTQMEYNFSLFWGVAIQAYESTLIADQTPFDKYMEQQQTYTLLGDNQKMSFTIPLQPGIVPQSVSVVGLNPLLGDMSDQDVFALDDGFGRFTVFSTGVDGTVDYARGIVTVNFEDPPSSQFPIKINYSVGSTPMTAGQLRGMVIFETKGRCIVCHGGPELSNAAVGTVGPDPLERMVMGDLNIRIYDTGFYHIGVRPGAEDAGLGGTDPVAGMPLSLGEEMRERVCNDRQQILIAGRPGDGVAQAPLNCTDDIARTGFFKAPQLRNVALTAPYFHNGSELTLEQVVEFYNRGADFNVVSELSIMDPDIEPLGLGLTLQEKQDLVDFLRNGLTDPRTLKQAAPFDHPQLFTPNGHPQGANGYPVQKDPNHPGQATNQLIEIPAVGANGGKPLPTFLQNIVGVKNVLPN
ncbi:MAG TPA: cytochrome c peroxidase [Terriglobales bacterium]|nr:cytochrome c peroxidase [Terriglobales bacterium]